MLQGRNEGDGPVEVLGALDSDDFDVEGCSDAYLKNADTNEGSGVSLSVVNRRSIRIS